MSPEETTTDTDHLPSRNELRRRGMVAKTGYFFPDCEASAGAKRQQKYRDEKLNQGLKPVSIYAPPSDRARKAVREIALRMKDSAFIAAAETLTAEPAAVSVLTGPIMELARAFVEPANDNFGGMTQRALADPILRDHLTAFSELDETIRAAILDDDAGEIGSLLLRAAEHCLADTSFREALARLVDEENLAAGIISNGADASDVLAATSSETVRDLATRAAAEAGLAEEALQFISRERSIRTSILSLTRSSPDVVQALAADVDIQKRLRAILRSPARVRLLEVLADVEGEAFNLLDRFANVSATPSQTTIALALMSREPRERRALALLDAAKLVLYFIEPRRGGREVDQEASNLNLFVSLLAQLQPIEVEALLSVQRQIRELASNERLRDTLATLSKDAVALRAVAMSVRAVGEGSGFKDRLAAAARILFARSGHR